MEIDNVLQELKLKAVKKCQNNLAAFVPRIQVMNNEFTVNSEMLIYTRNQAASRDIKRKAENVFLCKKGTVKRSALFDLSINVDTQINAGVVAPGVVLQDDTDQNEKQNALARRILVANAKMTAFGIYGSGIMKSRKENLLKISKDSKNYLQDSETRSQQTNLSTYNSMMDVDTSSSIKKKSAKRSHPKLPAGVVDFDKENMHDPAEVSNYAPDIFMYMKEREKMFQVDDYMSRQIFITKWMRTLLVDWLVEVQLDLDLNNETLYLAVKVTDIYLNKVVVKKEILQLVGASSLLIASKYDDRVAPLIKHFLYFCNNAFTRQEFIKMEQEIFAAIGCNLGIPLSYKFLRRFARCCKTTIHVLTLARYILELSLLEYSFIFVSESKIACAALYLALKMLSEGSWTPTLEFYSGYKLSEFVTTVLNLNAMMHTKPRDQVKTIRCKYWHKRYFEVAKIPLIDDSELFDVENSLCSIPKSWN